jgi:hypothetical protein
MSETKKPPKSFRISFETLFDRAVVEVKDEAKVRLMTEVHNKLLDNQTVTDAQLYDYCVYLWSFVDFVRDNPKLGTTVPLEWLVKGIACNCYWWEVLMVTNHYADRIAAAKTPVDSKAKLAVFRSTRNALGLLQKLTTEALPLWTDRGESTAFNTEVRKQAEIANALHKALWTKALTIGIEVAGRDLDKAHSVAQMCATLFELSDKKDVLSLTTGLLAQSRHLHHIADYGQAIALAQAYERIQGDITHPDLAEWLKTNESVWHAKIPAALDAGTALMTIGKSKAYEKGAPPNKVILFAAKKA